MLESCSEFYRPVTHRQPCVTVRLQGLRQRAGGQRTRRQQRCGVGLSDVGGPPSGGEDLATAGGDIPHHRTAPPNPPPPTPPRLVRPHPPTRTRFGRARAAREGVKG